MRTELELMKQAMSAFARHFYALYELPTEISDGGAVGTPRPTATNGNEIWQLLYLLIPRSLERTN
jgi:hypothetical protein